MIVSRVESRERVSLNRERHCPDAVSEVDAVPIDAAGKRSVKSTKDLRSQVAWKPALDPSRLYANALCLEGDLTALS